MSQGVNHRDLAGPAVSRTDWLVSAANPRDVDAALAWQLDRVGSGAWRTWSLKFQRLAFGYSQDTGWQDEAEAWRWLESHGLVYAGKPPRGALVWYTDEEVTRVACSLGRGRVVGALPSGEVGVAELDDLSATYAWSAPVFPFAH